MPRSSCSFRLTLPTLVLLALLAGCSRVGGDATQVAAKVNDAEISQAQLQHALQRQPAVAPERASEVAKRVLDVLIDQELAAQGARKQGLDKDPRVVQAIEAAKREVLAKAWQDAAAEKAPLPSSDEIDRYYDSQPALFAERRFYALQETTVQGAREDIAPLQERIEAATDAARVGDVLRDAKLRYASRQLTVSPEDVPLPLVARLADLKPGKSLLIRQPGGARVLTLLSSTPAPLSREIARPAIQAFLANESRRKVLAERTKALHEEAHIEHKAKFAQAAAQPVAAAAAASQPL
jgi:EpsD family peptidyl-prolyl cis-trans isomerase